MKLTKSCVLFFQLLSLCPSLLATGMQSTAATSPKVNSNQPNGFVVLPAIRRVGIDIFKVNIDEFRNFIEKKQIERLSGLPSLPMSQEDIQISLAETLEGEIQKSKRFWSVTAQEFVPKSFLTAKNGREQIQKIKTDLEKDYSLDAWIEPYVYFSADQTLVRLILKEPRPTGKTWLREDISLEPQANAAEIKQALKKAIGNFIVLLGHEGKVTYKRDNLLTLNFGLENGLKRGTEIELGYTVLSQFHPQTGEFLKTEKIPLYTAKVLEARNGSALCQLTKSNLIAIEQSKKMTNASKTDLLVWKKD